MADKNIQMTQRNAANTAWDNQFPITKAANVKTAGGSDVEAALVDYTKIIPYAVTTGTANTYAITTPVITALTAGMAVSVKINISSTNTSTLNWDGKGAKTIKKANGTNVTNLVAGGIYTMRYDGTNFILQGEGGSGDATASNLLSGKKANVDVGDIVGTMPDYSNAENIGYMGVKSAKTDGAGSIVFEPYTGYYREGVNANGFGSLIRNDPNFIAANMSSGKTYFGLAGTNTNKKWATGSGSQIRQTSASTIAKVVSGLAFAPTQILIKYTIGGNTYLSAYSDYLGINDASTQKIVINNKSTDGFNFTLHCYDTAVDYTWIAIE